MKASKEYFSEAHPFDAAKDGSLLDGLEQQLAVMRECELLGLGFAITATADGIQIQTPGDNVFKGPALRDALRAMLTSES